MSESEGIYCEFKENLLEFKCVSEVDITDGYQQIIQTFECDSKRRAHIMLDKIDTDYSFKLVVANGQYEEISRQELIKMVDNYNFKLRAHW